MASKKELSTGLQKLLEDQLADIYYAEKQLLKALPKMAKAAINEELSTAFEDHVAETQGQVERLEEVFAAMEIPAKAKRCPAIDGILEEGKEIMEEFADDSALDAGLIAAAQKVKHYEIASYGSMCAWAEQMGLEDVAALLTQTLEEEKATDEKLTGIAEAVNVEAQGEEEEEEEGETVEAEGGYNSSGKSKTSSGKGGGKSASTGSGSKSSGNGK